MTPDVTNVEYLGAHRLRLEFSDGIRGEVDLRSHVMGQGGVFEALENPAFFAQVRVNDDIGTIVWPNDADLSPDFLYGLVTTDKTLIVRRVRGAGVKQSLRKR